MIQLENMLVYEGQEILSVKSDYLSQSAFDYVRRLLAVNSGSTLIDTVWDTAEAFPNFEPKANIVNVMLNQLARFGFEIGDHFTRDPDKDVRSMDRALSANGYLRGVHFSDSGFLGVLFTDGQKDYGMMIQIAEPGAQAAQTGSTSHPWFRNFQGTWFYLETIVGPERRLTSEFGQYLNQKLMS
jgi:hypothetical protein